MTTQIHFPGVETGVSTTQTHGPKFRLHEQYLKRAVVTVLPQVSAGHHPEFIVLTYYQSEVYQCQSILFLSKSQLLDSAEELHQCLVCEERFQSYSTWIFQYPTISIQKELNLVKINSSSHQVIISISRSYIQNIPTPSAVN
jgi:hypothetical protein